MDRIKHLLSRSTRTSRILEIGPGHNPVAPKAGGWNTHVVDHTDRAQLLVKFRAWGVDVHRVEEVDTIWHGGPLHAAVPAAMHGTFDALIVSHVLEDIADPVGFFASAAILCRPGAAIALALADHRFCFDYFRPHSTTGDVLAAHLERRSRHGFAAIWNNAAYSARLDGAMVTSQWPVRRVELVSDLSVAAAFFASTVSQGAGVEYHDAHGWIFTPAGFALAMLELGRLGVVDWRIDELHPTAGCEFIAILTRGVAAASDAEAFQRQRLDLLTQRLLEQKEQIDFAVAGGLLPGTAAAPVVVSDTALVQHLAAQEAGLTQLHTEIATHVGALNDAIRVLCEAGGARALQVQALAPLAASVDDMQAQMRSIAAALQQLALDVARQEQRLQDTVAGAGTLARGMDQLAAHDDTLRASGARMAGIAADMTEQRQRVALLEQVLGRIAMRLEPFARVLRRFRGRSGDGNGG